MVKRPAIFKWRQKIGDGTGALSTLILTTGLRSYLAVELHGVPDAPMARLTELGRPGAGQSITRYLDQLPVPAQAAGWVSPVEPQRAPAAVWTPTPIPPPSRVPAVLPVGPSASFQAI